MSVFLIIIIDGALQVVVGDIRAASYGHSLGGAVGLAMVFSFLFIRDRRFPLADCVSHLKLQIHATKPLTPKAVEASKWEVDIAGTRYPAVASLKPMCVLCALPRFSNCNWSLQV